MVFYRKYGLVVVVIFIFLICRDKAPPPLSSWFDLKPEVIPYHPMKKIVKAKFPAIDIHGHLFSQTRLSQNALLEKMDRMNICTH